MFIPRKRIWAQATLATGVQTASTTSAEDSGYAGADALILQLAITAASGTVPTLDVIVEDTIDGTNWFTLGTFSQKITTGTQILRVNGPFGNALRAKSTITGTTPSFTFTVLAQAENSSGER